MSLWIFPVVVLIVAVWLVMFCAFVVAVAWFLSVIFGGRGA